MTVLLSMTFFSEPQSEAVDIGDTSISSLGKFYYFSFEKLRILRILQCFVHFLRLLITLCDLYELRQLCYVQHLNFYTLAHKLTRILLII